jgi:hypothetical protein
MKYVLDKNDHRIYPGDFIRTIDNRVFQVIEVLTIKSGWYKSRRKYFPIYRSHVKISTNHREYCLIARDVVYEPLVNIVARANNQEEQ